MKKKVLAALLCSAMAVSLLGGCGDNAGSGDAEKESTQSQESTEPSVEPTAEPAPEPVVEEPVAGEEIPTPAYYFSFDEADGTTGITPVAKGSPLVTMTDRDVAFIPGVKGEAAYVDGTYGLKLDVNGVGETYSVSYWMYANRNSNYMPTAQFGPDVHGDATGSEHWMNVTWADWSGNSEFPCIWSYDAVTGEERIANYEETGDTHLNQWINVTLVVDESKKTADGAHLLAEVYVNGEKAYKDKDINVVYGTMAPSDNYDFLLGVNYWDAMLKGAFDELYIFDTALTAGQAKTLYEMGDPTVSYNPPERVVEVKVDENALETIGNTDLNAGFWSDWTSAYEIPEGVTKVFKLNNFSSGLENWHNYVMVFTNEASEAHTDPNTASDSHKEWAAVRADAFGWTPDGNIPESAFTWTWGNWGSWSSESMVDADVTIEVKREGNVLNIVAHNLDYNGLDNIMNATVETAMADGDDCYMLFTCECSYVELMSVEDGVDITPNKGAIASLGTTTFGLGWWSEFTDGYEIKDGETKTVKLHNYSSGIENWHNYVIAFANTATTADKTPSADNYDGYAEYAVVRADIFGWGDASYAATFDSSWDDWDAWRDAMRDVDVTMAITRNGNTLQIDTTFVDRKGQEMTSTANVQSGLTESDPCYFFLTGEQAYIELLSVE